MAIKKLSNKKYGFTIMELLVVIGIIAVLIGIMVPSIKNVKRIAKNLEQKSMFHSMEIGLETYRGDFGEYPDSTRKPNGSMYYTGAQHLAEAMVGRDGRGFEPSQAAKWCWPGDEPSADYGLYDVTNPLSLPRRKPEYMPLKDTGAFLPGEMYTNPGAVVSEVNGQRAPVIADLFYRKRITITSTGVQVKVGSPILYYKADRSSKIYHRDPTGFGPAQFDKWIYNYNDNEHIIKLNVLDDPTVSHQLNESKFYDTITDDNAPYDRPHNDNTFILISAGYDGIYGTKDDVTNIKIK